MDSIQIPYHVFGRKWITSPMCVMQLSAHNRTSVTASNKTLNNPIQLCFNIAVNLEIYISAVFSLVSKKLEVMVDNNMDNDYRTATAGSDVVQSERPIFDDFFQHLWPYIGNNTANVVFQMVMRLGLIRIDQCLYIAPQKIV
ncbi:hypothetical protein TNCV_4703471 [Trichonephila clavipes]|nr:hypothetical protein TNCV_4703471 [Trichonephila clavipes]